MTFTDAAAEVLRLVGRPLHYKEITDIAIEKNLLSHVGKSPEVTMGARLAATLKKDSPENPLVRVKPGVFALRSWDEKTIKTGLDKRGDKAEKAADKGADKGAEKGSRKAPSRSEAPRGRARADEADEDEDEVLIGAGEDEEEAEAAPEAEDEAVAAAEPEVDEEAETEAEPVTPQQTTFAYPKAAEPTPSSPRAAWAAPAAEDDEDEEPGEAPGPDDTMRAEAAAGAAEMFDEEDDDDQPILGGGDDRASTPGAEQGEGRRRRRRRRRGRSTNGETTPAVLPAYTATPVYEVRREGREGREGRDNREPRDNREGRELRDNRDGAAENYRPQVIDLSAGEGPALDDLTGRELSDAIAGILATFDRNAGAVSLRQIAETAQKRGRLAGDAQIMQSQIAAAVRADNARRAANGQRPRFRLAGGRVALTDWLLSPDLARLEQEALAAVERYREAARRAFTRKLAELPGHAFVEVVVLALEKLGVSQLRAIRRPGAAGGETHFAGVLRLAGADEVRVAIVIRRDGREVGRERVTELRGSLHHYNQASAGWIFTAGQMLSGAREEASVAGTPPIALYDGAAVARLCEDNDVAVLRAKLPIAIPDVDLLEALRAS